MNKMNGLSYVLSFIEGILTFISPCMLPLLPVYLSYLAGMSGEEGAGEASKPGRLFTNSIGFVIGFTVVFVSLGAAATSLGYFLKSHIDIFRKISGVVMIIFGLNFMGVLKLNFLNLERRIEYRFNELRFFNSVIFGGVFGFGWTPCLGAFLGSALLMAGNSDTLVQGITLLLAYSAGLGLPFIIASLVFEKVKNIFRRIQKHSRIISIVSGMVLILAGVLVFADRMKYLSTVTW